MKSHIPKQRPNIIRYRRYKHFNKNKFEKEILNRLSKCNKETFKSDEFKELFIATLNIHAPLKTKFLRTNLANFISKELTKAIMLRLICVTNILRKNLKKHGYYTKNIASFVL